MLNSLVLILKMSIIPKIDFKGIIDLLDTYQSYNFGDYVQAHVEEEKMREEIILEVVKTYFSSTSPDPNAETKHGMTILHHAVAAGLIKIVKYLIEDVGVDPHKKDSYECNALSYASFYDDSYMGIFGSTEKSYMDIARLLLEADVDTELPPFALRRPMDKGPVGVYLRSIREKE